MRECKPVRVIRAAAGLFVLLTLAQMPLPDGAMAQEQRAVVIATASPGGVYQALGGAICRLVNLSSDKHGLRCSERFSAGSVANIEALRAGKTDLAIVQTDVARDAYRGEAEFADTPPFADLRLVLPAHEEPFAVIVSRESGIRVFEDLRGKRINMGNPGSGHRFHMDIALAALGLKPEDFAAAYEMPPVDQVRAFCGRSVDAIVYTVGHPNGLVQQAVRDCDGRILAFRDSTIARLRDVRSDYVRMQIPGGLYPGHPDPVPTLGTHALIVARAELPDATARDVVEAVLANFDIFRMLHPAFQSITRDSIADKTGSLPWHPGAADALESESPSK